MARALLTLAFFTYRSPHHSSKICQKIHVDSLENRWLSGPQVAQLFCSGRTITARALNCGCLAVSRTANLRIDNKSPIFFAGLAQ